MDNMETIRGNLGQEPISINGSSRGDRLLTCHPDRPYYAKGLCKNCYRKTKPPSREAKDRHNKYFREVHYPKNKIYYAERSRRWRDKPENRQKEREYAKKTWANPKTRRKQRSYYYQWKYGITVEQRETIMLQNDGLCMICNERVSTHLDHDHDTGVIRGALCHMCNKGLGHFKDNVSKLKSAIRYLER